MHNKERYMNYGGYLRKKGEREILIGPNQMSGLKYRDIVIGPGKKYEPIYRIVKISDLIKKLNNHN